MLVELAMDFGFELVAVGQQEGTQGHIELDVTDCNAQLTTRAEGMKTQDFTIPCVIQPEGLGQIGRHRLGHGTGIGVGQVMGAQNMDGCHKRD